MNPPLLTTGMLLGFQPLEAQIMTSTTIRVLIHTYLWYRRSLIASEVIVPSRTFSISATQELFNQGVDVTMECPPETENCVGRDSVNGECHSTASHFCCGTGNIWCVGPMMSVDRLPIVVPKFDTFGWVPHYAGVAANQGHFRELSVLALYSSSRVWV